MIRFWILQDWKENRRKCTVEPLGELEGLELLRLGRPRPGHAPVLAPGGILLSVDAPALTMDDRARLEASDARVVVLDATWARLEALRRRIEFPDELPDGVRLVPRSLPGSLVTAYPRVSKLHADPGAGLATVEALFAATVILGEPRPELLEHYHWAAEFRERNRI